MLKDFELPGVEWVGTAQRRNLVTHTVPGLEGAYSQDLGAQAVEIEIVGSRHENAERDDFLTRIRGLYAAREPMLFTSNILTATEVTDVLTTALEVQEFGGPEPGFRYRLGLRQYVEPPPPAKPGLPGTDLLGEASALADALEVLDALASLPSLADPTAPLKAIVGEVGAAADEIGAALADIEAAAGGGT
jgi:hypothetical protein